MIAPGDLAHAFDGRLLRRQSFAFHQRLAVFYHHDGVVAQRTDHENQAEHGQHVDAVIEHQHEGKCSQKRDRNGDGGYQSRPPVLQKKPCDQYHQKQRRNDGRDDFRHGNADEFGRVVSDLIADAGRETFRPGVEFGLDAPDCRQRIRFRRPVDRHGDGFPAVENAFSRIALGADPNAGDILQENYAAVRITP